MRIRIKIRVLVRVWVRVRARVGLGCVGCTLSSLLYRLVIKEPRRCEPHKKGVRVRVIGFGSGLMGRCSDFKGVIPSVDIIMPEWFSVNQRGQE